MEKADGSNAPQNADTLPHLSCQTARRSIMTEVTKRTTGEPCNAKVLSTVRWGTMGKGPGNWYLACSLPNYQQGPQLGFWNVREYVLFRDGHTCKWCLGKSGDKIFNVHHIESRKTGGDSPDNLITLCETC